MRRPRVEDSIGIAILTVELPLNWKLSKLKGLLGLIPHRNKKYNHKLRSVLSRTAIAIYLNKKRYKRMLKVLKGIPENLPYRKVARILEVK